MIATTITMLIGAFGGLNGEKSQMLRWFSGALGPLALGLLVFSLALFCRNYLRDRLERMDFEMKDASRELLEILARL